MRTLWAEVPNAAQLLGNGPQCRGIFSIPRSSIGLYLDGRSCQFEESAGAPVATALRFWVGGSAEGRQCTHMGILCDVVGCQLNQRRVFRDLTRGVAWVGGNTLGCMPGSSELSIEFKSEQKIRHFTLSVGRPSEVKPLTVKVVKVDEADVVGETRNCNHPTVCCVEDALEEEASQGKVSQVIGRKVEFKSLFGDGSRWAHDPRVVDQ